MDVTIYLSFFKGSITQFGKLCCERNCQTPLVPRYRVRPRYRVWRVAPIGINSRGTRGVCTPVRIGEKAPVDPPDRSRRNALLNGSSHDSI